MEVYFLAPESIKIKGKNVAFVTSPKDIKTKTEADCVLALLSNESVENPKIEGARVTIDAPGEYEVTGAKIVSQRSGENIVYSIKLDGLGILLGALVAIEQLKDKLEDKHHVVIACVSEKLNEETITSLEPSVTVLFGPGAKEAAKVLGKDGTASLKYQTTLEKLPAEMEVVVLG